MEPATVIVVVYLTAKILKLSIVTGIEGRVVKLLIRVIEHSKKITESRQVRPTRLQRATRL